MSGFTCSAAVFSTFSEELGLDAETAKKIACGFGAGVSKTGNMCGAVSGAIMVIGLKYGKSRAGDNEATDTTRALTREFIRKFSARNGAINCTALLGYDLSNPEDYRKAAASGLFITSCKGYVRDAVEILDGILSQPR